MPLFVVVVADGQHVKPLAEFLDEQVAAFLGRQVRTVVSDDHLAKFAVGELETADEVNGHVNPPVPHCLFGVIAHLHSPTFPSFAFAVGTAGRG
jgi:phenylalanine-4-hydroxylase